MTRLGVVGAGTMGSGIAEVSILAGFETSLHDPVADSFERGLETIRAGLTKAVGRGSLSATAMADAIRLLHPAANLDQLAQCDLVIEAAPEDLEVKRTLFASLAEVCGHEVVFATNTSSLQVTAIATGVPSPERVVGMHFFNPVQRMRLLEIVPAVTTAPQTIERGRAIGLAMGKSVIIVQDSPGFLVNRCGRPFYGEALRILQERIAEPEQIDRICRMGAGFRMGPFELMDLVGIDVGFAVANSFATQSFGEPRWRPNPLQARMVTAGRLGRKTGQGWYIYNNGPYRADDPAPPEIGGGDRCPLVILGEGSVASRLRDLARTAGFDLRTKQVPGVETIAAEPGLLLDEHGLSIVSCATSSLAAAGLPKAIGFSLLPDAHRLIELTRGLAAKSQHAQRAASLFRAMGLHVEWVGDSPGLVLGRIITQIINEACFAVGEGVASSNDVDTGLRLGLNYPTGAFEWAEHLGWARVMASLNGLWGERREERYRPAPFLLQTAASEAAAHA